MEKLEFETGMLAILLDWKGDHWEYNVVVLLIVQDPIGLHTEPSWLVFNFFTNKKEVHYQHLFSRLTGTNHV
jgi:hypothetical protein